MDINGTQMQETRVQSRKIHFLRPPTSRPGSLPPLFAS